MHVTITFRHLETTEAIKTHIEEKLERFKKYLIHPIEAHVILSIEKFRHQCEITLSARHFHATAIETNHNMYTSIDKAVSKLERQVKKHKEIIKKHKFHQNQLDRLAPRGLRRETPSFMT